MLLVVGLHGSLESFEGVVNLLVDGHVYFGGSGPEDNDAVGARLSLEAADVFAELLYEFPPCAFLHVVAVETLGVVVVESGGHGLDGLEFFANGLDVLLFEDFGVDGRFVGVGGIYVPCGEHDVVEVSNGNDFVVFEVFLSAP